jgi:putative oxidoreductase
MLFSSLSKYTDLGLLFLRIVFGCMFLFYGAPMLFGGPQKWAQAGQAMGNLGINFAWGFWGFMAGLAEFGGGICLILGLFFRPACFFLMITMIVAARMHLAKGEGVFGAAHAIEDGVVFLSLIFIGPGKYSLDALLRF